MRIGFSTLSEDPNAPSGAQGYYINTIRELSEVAGDNHEIYLFVSSLNEHLYGPYSRGNVTKVFFPCSNENRRRRVLVELFGLARVIRQYKLDVINTGVAPFLCPCRMVATMKTMHAYTSPKDLTLPTVLYRRLMYRWTAWRADAVISNSNSHTADLKKYLKLPERKIRLVYEALDHETFNPLADRATVNADLNQMGISGPFILFVSSLWPYKNAEVLMRSFAQIKDEFPEHQLVIAGFARDEAYADKLQTTAQAEQIAGRTIFTGGLPHDELVKLYQTADIFVYPSMYETFGLTILEAMASGCPVVTSNVSSMPEIAGDSAVLVDPKNVEALSSVLRRILGSSEERQVWREKGIKRAATFTWRRTAEETLNAFLSVCK